jgi:hypothetical protein
MTPNKFNDLQSTIKGFLEFMNGRNLHRIFVFFLNKYSIPTKFLKSNVFQRDYGDFCMYSGNIVNILNVKR